MSQTQPLNTAAASPAGTPAEPSNALRWKVVLLCALICLLDGYDMVVAPISVPVLAEAWGLEAAAFTAMLTATVLGMALGAAFLAPLGDRFGRRPVIIASFALVGASSLLTPLSSTVVELGIFRLATGLGMGASLANALAMASEYATPRIRSRIITCVYSMSAVGSVLGGFVAPPILAAYGWEGLYVAGGAVPLLVVPALLLALPESRHFLELKRLEIKRLELQGQTGENEESFRPPGTLGSVRLLLVPPYRGRTVLLWTLFFLSTFTVYVISSWLPTLMRLYGWSIENSVRAIMVFSFGGIVGGFLLGWLVDRSRIRPALLLGFIASGLAMLSLNIAPTQIGLWMTLIAVIGGGMIGINYAMTALAALVYPTELRAGGIGAASAMGRLGATVAPLVGGWLLALNWSALQIFTGLIGPMLVGAVIIALFSRLFDVREG